MFTESPLVSVVTPVYNGEPYLRECIESVLAQTYTHWDYTIVNNCSTDRTLTIALEYAAKDPRIRIHNNDTFVGAIENHNVAFRQISPVSKYCKVVDADDWLIPECLDKMVRVAENHPNVIIVSSYSQYSIAEKGIGFTGLPYRTTFVPGGREACRLRLLGGPYVFGHPTNMLLRSDIVRSRYAFYNESNIHCDSEICFEFLGDHDFGFVHQVLTGRRVREDSATAHSRSLNTYFAGRLLELVKYGDKYLTDTELKHSMQALLTDYYHYLGWEIYKGRDRLFWDYHRLKLAELGYPLSMLKVTAAAVCNALDLLLNPKSTAERAVRRLQRIWSERSRRAEATESLAG